MIRSVYQSIPKALRPVFSGLCCIALCSGVQAASDPNEQVLAAGLTPEVMSTAIALRDQSLEASSAYAIVESLTTEIGPRLAGSEAEARARDWAVKMLRAKGFDNVRIETFEVPGWERGEERAAIVAPFPQPLIVTALGGSVATPKEGITAEVALFETLDDLRYASREQVAGKIVYVSHAMQRTQDGSSYGYFGRVRRESPELAAAKGAVGVMIRSVGTDQHRFPHTGQTRYAADVTPVPAAALSNPDADQLERIAARGEPITVNLLLTPKAVGTVQSGNVIADIVGSDYPDEIVIIGGHLDSWDLGTGAIDDGAGVGITVAAAELINALDTRPKRTLRLILWGAEEIGLLGGRAYVERHRASLRKHVSGTESDFGGGRVWQLTSRVAPEIEPFVAVLAQTLAPLGVARGRDDVASSGPDLIPMVSAGMPAIRLVQDGSDYFDYHHTPDDTLDKVNALDLNQNVAAFVVFSWLATNTSLADWGWQDVE
jgi:Zn-dependent M28 family amino/carboxypeptidase